MCGLSGILAKSAVPPEELKTILDQMGGAISHRGPDSSGIWVERVNDWALGLGHQRLAIVDLSPAGHQPMASRSGRYIMAFNGEIYNHADLRREIQQTLTGVVWKGHSDTETLLSGFEAWGIEETLKRAVGMFAIAVWDMVTGLLSLARDRFGEKPLYYGWVSGTKLGREALVFSSELKAFKSIPGFSNPVSSNAMGEFFRFQYIPAPMTIYQQIFKVEPGTLLVINPKYLTVFDQPPVAGESKPGVGFNRYWSYRRLVEEAKECPYQSEEESLSVLESVLTRAVSEQSLADVPLGAFLSGGVDSSLIVALMQRNSQRRIDTFTIGFDVPGFDESEHARAVADHLGTNHHELRLTPADAINLVQELPQMYCEPFADSSQIPTHLVCRSARQNVTVALSGDAGDELFGGYNRYLWGPRIWNKTAWMGRAGRNTMCRFIQSASPSFWDKLLGASVNSDSLANGVVRPGEKLHKLASRLKNTSTLDDLYFSLCSEWRDLSELMNQVLNGSNLRSGVETLPENLTVEERMMYLDALTYLPGDILCKVDRAAMAISLETRAPFLDHRVAEAAWRLPMHLKISGGIGKQALRKILYQYVPRQLIERPKAGFALPVGQWLRAELKEWAQELLMPKRLQDEGFLKSETLAELWRQHQSGTHDHSGKLWTVLMWQAWLERNQEI